LFNRGRAAADDGGGKNMTARGKTGMGHGSVQSEINRLRAELTASQRKELLLREEIDLQQRINRRLHGALRDIVAPALRAEKLL
jgi:hypothetical protein